VGHPFIPFMLIAHLSRIRPAHPLPASLVGLAVLAGLSAPAGAEQCQFLQPIGGNGSSPVVSKTVGRGKLIGKTNWNTDFIVSKPYRSYRFVFTAQSSAKATYPIEGYLKFSDGSALRVINETITPQVGGSRQWGPFPAVPGKAVSQLNLKIGSSRDPGSTGFTYRIGSQGCF